jgi:hypothetical protein
MSYEQGELKHEVWVRANTVEMAQVFNSRDEVEDLIDKLRKAADEAWPQKQQDSKFDPFVTISMLRKLGLDTSRIENER